LFSRFVIHMYQPQGLWELWETRRSLLSFPSAVGTVEKRSLFFHGFHSAAVSIAHAFLSYLVHSWSSFSPETFESVFTASISMIQSNDLLLKRSFYLLVP
jgi:hypothetical protein